MQDRFKFRYVFKKDFGGKIGICYKMPIFNLDTITDENFNKIVKSYIDYGYKLISIEQSTGLKDKNGKLIYGGDIVKDLTYLHEVKYVCAFLPIFGGLGLISNQDLKDYEFCKENWESFTTNDKVRKLDNRFKLANQGNKLKCFNMNNLKMNDYEVVGNIYENPELLEKENQQ